MILFHAGSSTTVTLTGRLEARVPLDAGPDRLQNVGEYEDGVLEVYDRDVVIWLATFLIHGMTQSQLDTLRDFFIKTVKGSKEPFTLTPASSFSLGAGLGQPVTVQLFGKLPLPRLYVNTLYEQKFTVRYRSTGVNNPT